MSVQDDIETAIGARITAAIATATITLGPVTQVQVEGDARAASVYLDSATSSRLSFGQNEWTESYTIFVWWSATIDRDTRIAEWEAVQSEFLANQYLVAASPGVVDSYLVGIDWGEAHDSGLISMAAELEVKRVE